MSMSSRITDPGATARHFLLGQLSDGEAKAFEEQLLTDDELVAETDAVQTELYDQFGRGELMADERAVFAQRFASRREKMIFASALAARATQLPRSNIRWALPIAASVMLVTGAIAIALALVYWKWGIEAAIVAHFAGDVTVHVAGPYLFA